MYSAAFIFEPGIYDARFHELNALIDQAAGGHSRLSRQRIVAIGSTGKRSNATYYWTSLEALKQFSSHPKHLEAKLEYKKWYRGYHIVIAQVVRSYGDGAFEHFTPNARDDRRA